MTDFGQFQEPFAEVPLESVEPECRTADQDSQETAEPWWVDDHAVADVFTPGAGAGYR